MIEKVSRVLFLFTWLSLLPGLLALNYTCVPGKDQHICFDFIDVWYNCFFEKGVGHLLCFMTFGGSGHTFRD